MRSIAKQIGYEITGKTKAAIAEELAGAVDMVAGMDPDLKLNLPGTATATAAKATAAKPKADPKTDPKATKLPKHQKAVKAAQEAMSPQAKKSTVENMTIKSKGGSEISFAKVDPTTISYGDEDMRSGIVAATKLAKSFGYTPIFAAGDSLVVDGASMAGDWDGFVVDGQMVLNAESPGGLVEWTSRHEIGHLSLDGMTAEEKHDFLRGYYTLRRAWAERRGTTDQLEKRFNDIINHRVIDQSNPDAVYEELLCDDIADAWSDRDFAEYVMAENLNMWQRFTRAVARVVNRMKAVFSGQGKGLAHKSQLCI